MVAFGYVRIFIIKKIKTKMAARCYGKGYMREREKILMGTDRWMDRSATLSQALLLASLLVQGEGQRRQH